MKKAIIAVMSVVLLIGTANMSAMTSKVENAIASEKYTNTFAQLAAAKNDKEIQSLITRRGVPFTLADYKAWKAERGASIEETAGGEEGTPGETITGEEEVPPVPPTEEPGPEEAAPEAGEVEMGEAHGH